MPSSGPASFRGFDHPARDQQPGRRSARHPARCGPPSTIGVEPATGLDQRARASPRRHRSIVPPGRVLRLVRRRRAAALPALHRSRQPDGGLRERPDHRLVRPAEPAVAGPRGPAATTRPCRTAPSAAATRPRRRAPGSTGCVTCTAAPAAARAADRIMLAGHSNGGLFSLLYASRHPSQVAGLVLIDGVHPGYHPREVAMLHRHLPPAPGATSRRTPATSRRRSSTPSSWTSASAEDADAAALRRTRSGRCPSRDQPRLARRELSSAGPVAPRSASGPGSRRARRPRAGQPPRRRHPSDHDIQHEQPGLVLRQLTAVVAAVRHGRHLGRQPDRRSHRHQIEES